MVSVSFLIPNNEKQRAGEYKREMRSRKPEGNYHKMDPVLVITTLANHSESFLITIVHLTDNVERIPLEPDRHVDGLLCLRELLHLAVEQIDQSIHARLILKDATLSVQGGDDSASLTMLDLVSLREPVSSSTIYMRIETIIEISLFPYLPIFGHKNGLNCCGASNCKVVRRNANKITVFLM